MKFRVALTLVTLILVFGSCGEDSIDDIIDDNPTIPVSDVVGLEYVNYYRVPKYWKDGVASTLVSGSLDAEAVSISKSNGDVFIAGVAQNESGGHNSSNSKRPIYWKNGTEYVLPVVDFGVGVSTNTNGVAHDIYAENGVPYVVGYMSDGGRSFFIATLWVDGGNPILLGDPRHPLGESSQAEAVVVNDGKVYIAGYNKTTTTLEQQAILWVDGVRTELTDGTESTYAYDVFVDGGDVYVCGRVINSNYVWRAVYWKNGVINYLTDGIGQADAKSIYVNNGDVYVAGSFDTNADGSTPDATLWKNGAAQKLNNAGRATGVTVKNGDVYVSGTGDQACIWKNGTLFNLGAGIAEDVLLP